MRQSLSAKKSGLSATLADDAIGKAPRVTRVFGSHDDTARVVAAVVAVEHGHVSLGAKLGHRK